MKIKFPIFDNNNPSFLEVIIGGSLLGVTLVAFVAVIVGGLVEYGPIALVPYFVLCLIVAIWKKMIVIEWGTKTDD